MPHQKNTLQKRRKKYLKKGKTLAKKIRVKGFDDDQIINAGDYILEQMMIDDLLGSQDGKTKV